MTFKIDSIIEAFFNRPFYREKLLSSNFDEDLKAQVLEILLISKNVVGYKLNKWSYVVQSQQSATCP